MIESEYTSDSKTREPLQMDRYFNGTCNEMNTLRKITAISLLSFASAVCTSAQLSAESMIASADLKADLKILRRAYEELHPGLYRYNTKAQMDANFSALEAEFIRDRSLRDAYLAFSVFTAKIKCGHSYPNFFNQPKDISAALFKGKDKLPFQFRWLDEKMIVVKNLSSDARIKPGTEIVSINGVLAKSILARLMTVARADGSNDAKRVAYLEVLGNDRIEAFDVYFPLFYPLSKTTYSLNVRPLGTSRTFETSVEPLTYDERLRSMNVAGDSSNIDGPAFKLTYADSDTAVLNMPGWSLYNSKWDWKKFINDKMDELIDNKIRNLVVDIRGNEGGLDVGDVLISRLIDRDLSLTATQRFVRYQKIPADLKQYLDTWDRSFDDWGPAASDPKDGLFRLRRFDDILTGSVIKPSGRKFTGFVFVLVGASNSSATFQFAQTIKLNRLGTLVGQPTGGNQRGINGGAFYFLRLPSSKIEIDLPLIGQFPATESPDAGIDPDIYVKVTASDIAAGRDAEMEAVKRAITSRKEK